VREHKECRYLLDSLSDFIDGTLSSEICDEIERHMADCENCRIVVDSLRKTIYLYHETTAPLAVPDEVRARLYQRLDLEEFLEN